MRTETILVVDDEAIVRKLIHYCLKKRGYSVLEAASGNAALEICQTHRGKIDLAIIDVIMPGIHGPQLERYINKLIPEMRILYMSGFPHIEAINRGMSDFISKPFTVENLLKQVRASLDARATVSDARKPEPDHNTDPDAGQELLVPQLASPTSR